MIQREQKEACSHCTSVSRLLLLSPSGYLQHKTNYKIQLQSILETNHYAQSDNKHGGGM